MADKDLSSRNEGEGNRTAAREYNEATRKFVESGQVEARAKDAERARESDERKELDAAEKEGLSHVKEEDPALRGPRQG
jgi:hypothetical protein